MHIINLFGEPGAGKSTMAAAVFNLMKRSRLEVELVTEAAKDYTYDKMFTHLADQLMVLAEQHHRLFRLREQVEFVVTDSPVPTGLLFADHKWAGRLHGLITDIWGDDTNHSFLVYRPPNVPYQRFGRNQTEEEAAAIAERVRHLVRLFGGPTVMQVTNSDPAAEYKIVNHVLAAAGRTERV